MARVQFIETVVLPLGPGGSLVPIAGIATTPFTINPDESEGAQGTAYAARTGSTVASSLVTDSTGTVRYWLDAGDYNIHFADQQSPVRIASWIQGFNAALVDTTSLVTSTANLIQFTGDYKFSLQTADHGVKPDSSFEWLLITGGTDGLGRKVAAATYPALYALMGSPMLDISNNFRLPNRSGHFLMPAGAASGLTNRVAGTGGGAETHVLTVTEMPSHTHTDSGHTHTYLQSAAVPGTSSAITGSADPASSNTGVGFANLASVGGGLAHDNMSPWWAENLFIKT